MINLKDKLSQFKALLEQMTSVTVYEISIFQTVFYVQLQIPNKTTNIQNLFIIKPRHKYDIRETNMLLQPL